MSEPKTYYGKEAFIRPEKPFVLLNKDEKGHDVVFWFETEEELIWTAKNNKGVEPYAAFEIGSKRDIGQLMWLPQINVNDIDKYLVQRENIAEVDTLVGDPEVIQRKNCEIYSASGKSRLKEACELYKKIMKSTDTKDIDNITDINMAKQIIKMLVSDINRMHMEAVVSNGKME